MKIWNSLKNLFLPIMLLGLLSGALTGAWITLYRFFAARIIALSAEGYGFLREKPYWIPAVLLLFLFCAFLLALLYRRWPNLRGGGIPSSIAALRGMQPIRWLCDLIGVFCLSLCTFFFGVPLGNEGPSVQMGTSIGSACVRILPKKHRAWERYAMTGGACAGFSAATGAPLFKKGTVPREVT